MSPTVLALLAFTPLLLAGILLVGLRIPARRAMPLSFVATAALALTAWQVETTQLLAAVIEGLFLTFNILLIVAWRPSAAASTASVTTVACKW